MVDEVFFADVQILNQNIRDIWIFNFMKDLRDLTDYVKGVSVNKSFLILNKLRSNQEDKKNRKVWAKNLFGITTE